MAILATFHCACANSVIVPVGNMTPDSYLAHRISYKWGNCGDRNIDEAVFAILYYRACTKSAIFLLLAGNLMPDLNSAHPVSYLRHKF